MIISVILLFNLLLFSQEKPTIHPAWMQLGDSNLKGWTGAEFSDEGARLKVPGAIEFRQPDGAKGRYLKGLQQENDGTIDARKWYGIRFDIQLDRDVNFVGEWTVYLVESKDRHNLPDSSSVKIPVSGKNWQTITIPFSSFDYNRGQVYFLKFIKRLQLKGVYEDGSKGQVQLRNIKLVSGNTLVLKSDICSKPEDETGKALYEISVTNCSEKAQSVRLNIQRNGWEAMKASVSPGTMFLQPGESKNTRVEVTVPENIPQGAHENQMITATAGSSESNPATIGLITLKRLKSPFLVHQQAGWDEVKAKVEKYEWAKNAKTEFITTAERFQVDEVPPGGKPSDMGTNGIFRAYTEQQLWKTAVAYKLTGEKKYAEKVALYLLRLSDYKNGYPLTLHATLQGLPQEGGMFEGCVASYDLIKDSGILTQADCKQIEHTFRLFCGEIIDMRGDGGISNWSVFNLAPAAECALMIHDLDLFNKLLYGPTGLIDQFRYGTMDDGWWYEVSLSYNLGAAACFTQTALAARPFGIDLLNLKFPASLTQNVGLRPFEYENFQGMAFGKFGPMKDNSVTIKKLWDGILIYPDYRGVMFGMGDGHEQFVAGGQFEMAYFAFRDPDYASVLKQSKQRDLIYGVPELPENTPKLYAVSGHSDNAGIAVLRSQTEGREQKDQIQAAVKYGTHGGYHGHFDRASLLSLMRYGRSFWNPETSWFGYGSYMYKWWVQTSMVSNMVVIDGKMQEPKETNPILFFSGKMMQAVAVETNARWSNPPYLGGYEQIEKVKAGDAPYVTIPENHPKVADVTDYTEPVLQRRLMIVADDYVVLADYLKAEKEHTFDNLLHLRGAKTSNDLKFIGHDAQFDSSPLSTGQFITSVDNFATDQGAKIPSRIIASSENGWDTGGFNGYQEPGDLNIDVYHAWPQKAEVRIGNYAEGRKISKKLVFEVVADGKQLIADSLGTWILGNKSVDVNVEGIKMLQLRVKTNRGQGVKNTLFWANAKLVTSKGKEIAISQLKSVVTNVIQAKMSGKDYEGGPVKIAGTEYSDVLATEPENTKEYAVISLDLTGLDAQSFKANIGGDYPVGDEDQVRKTVSYRTSGKEARFISVLEPYESKSLIKSVKAKDASTVVVELTDGRVHEIKIQNLEGDGKNVGVTIQEFKNGQMVRTETN